MISCKKAATETEHSRRRSWRRGPYGLLAFVVLSGACTQTWPEPPADLRAEAIVVLGNRPPTDEAGRVMPETERRLRRGIELFEKGHAPVMMMTGGRAPRGDIEAEVMRDFAVELGVPANAIMVETQSRNTIENARLAKQLISAEGAGERSPRVILVTSPSHLERARRLFDCAGFDVVPAASDPPSRVLHRVGFTAYEVMATFYYAFIDECARAAGPSSAQPSASTPMDKRY